MSWNYHGFIFLMSHVCEQEQRSNLTKIHDFKGMSILHYAAQLNDHDLVEMIIYKILQVQHSNGSSCLEQLISEHNSVMFLRRFLRKVTATRALKAWNMSDASTPCYKTLAHHERVILHSHFKFIEIKDHVLDCTPTSLEQIKRFDPSFSNQKWTWSKKTVTWRKSTLKIRVLRDQKIVYPRW